MQSSKDVGGKIAVKDEHKLFTLLEAALNDDQLIDCSIPCLQNTARPRQGHKSSGRFN